MGSDILASTLICLGSRCASANELVVLSSAAARSVMDELGPEFERGSGIRPVFSYHSASALAKSIEAGERFDVAVLTPRSISALVSQGKILHEGRRTFGDVGMGVAAKRGAAKPDISTPDKLVAALRAASVIAVPAAGVNGDYFGKIVKDLRLADILKGRMRPVTSLNEMELIADGHAALGIRPAKEILAIDGVELVGRLPDPFQSVTGLELVISSESKVRQAARKFVAFVTSEAAYQVIAAKGMTGQ